MTFLKRRILFDSPHGNNDLAKRSIRGGVTTLSAQGAQFVMNLGSTAILARLLTPGDYGIFGMVTVVVSFAQMFKDAGLSTATIQKDTISEDQIATLFWINVLLSLIIGLVVLLCAPLVAGFYKTPELTNVTAVLSISFLLGGLTIQHKALLQRHLQFGVLAGIQIASFSIFIFVSVILACYGWKHWALVYGTLAKHLTEVLLTLFFCRWIPSRIKRNTGVRDMLRFGGHLTAFDFINYFSRNADNILIGKYLGDGALGIYSKAYQLFMLPIAQIRLPINRVATPVLSSLKNQPERYVKYYKGIIEVMATIAVPVTFYCAIETEFLIRLILGEQWMQVVPVFRILAAAGMIQTVASTGGLVLISHGYSRRYLYFGAVNATFIVAAFIAGLPFGIEGVAAAYAIMNYLLLVPALYYCFHKTPVKVGLFFKTMLHPIIASSLAGLTIIALDRYLNNQTFIAHALYFGLFSLVYLSLTLSRPSTRRTIQSILTNSNSTALTDSIRKAALRIRKFKSTKLE
jgi:O-antigen/teichoic acid export membrane protein